MFLPKALYWGHDSARDCYGLQIRNIVDASYTNLGEIPVIIGECGVPMDMKYVIWVVPLLFLIVIIVKGRRSKLLTGNGKDE